MTNFEAAVMACAAGPLKRLGLVLFAEDPYDPDPRQRASSFMAGARHCGAEALLIDRPPAPTGHGAARDPEFDTRFGARVAGFMAG
jgi:hypothetical protein